MTTTEKPFKPYQDLLVVSLEQAVAAPLCSCKLAEGGARVIKIERKGGDFARNYDSAVKGESSYFVWANHGKESLELDIKNEEDIQLLNRILAKADVFIQNLAPGAAERAGLGSESLRERNPRLITCDISGYGEAGEYRDMKAYDFLVQCESGLVSISGGPADYGRIGVSLCDIGAGTNAFMGIQQALFAREKTNRGTGIKVSLFDTAADWMTVPLMHAQYGSGAPERIGLNHPSIAPYGGYKTSDNETLAISIQNEREWKSLCENVLSMPQLTGDPKYCNNQLRVENRKQLDTQINRGFSSKTRQEMEALLRSASIAYGALNSVDSLIDHPQLRRRNVTLANGKTADLVAPAVQYSYEDDDIKFGKVPEFGSHSDSIRAEFSNNKV